MKQIKRVDVLRWLRQRVASELRVAPESVATGIPLRDLGLDSVRGISVLAELGLFLECDLDPAMLFEFPTLDELANTLCSDNDAVVAVPSSFDAASERLRERAAIIGMACRFPGARNLAEFAQLLDDGRCAVAARPADPSLRNFGAEARHTGTIEGIDQFDHSFFGISPKEALVMDPQQRLLLEVTWEALEDAGIPPRYLQGSNCGVFVGISSNEYAQHVAGTWPMSGHEGTGNALSVAANRISYFYGLRGPSMSIDTACSSSAVALHLARQSIERGECETALVAGTNLLLSHELFDALSSAGILSASGLCRAFDDRADGYVRAEGIGVVVLKAEAEAKAVRHRIYAIVAGSAVNQDGRSNGLTAPNPHAQEAVIRESWQGARVDAGGIQYIETHGTGTRLGDRVEAAALARVLAGSRTPICIGSVKSNIGHLEAAAGIAGVIKAALAIHRRRIPATLHCEKPNRLIPFAASGLCLATESTTWPECETPRAGVSAFGFGGTNVHVVLEAAPAAEVARPEGINEEHLLVLSAHTTESAFELARRYQERLQVEGAVDIEDACCTAATRRTHHRYRIAAIGQSAQSIASELERLTRGARSKALYLGDCERGKKPRVLFVFSGQGHEFAGIAEELCIRYPVFESTLRQIDTSFRTIAGWSVLEAMHETAAESRFNETTIAQPVIVALQIALTALLRAMGVEPAGCMGHSVGEVSAAVAAGMLDCDEALELVFHRSRHMECAAGQGCMLSLAVGENDAQQYARRFGVNVEIAATNGPQETVVAGARTELSALHALAMTDGVRARWISRGYAFHSAAMEAASQQFEQCLTQRGVLPSEIPLYSTVTGNRIEANTLTPAYWRANVRKPVAYHQALQTALADGYDLVLEVGPHAALHTSTQHVIEAVRSQSRAVALLRRDRSVHSCLLNAAAEIYTAGGDLDWSTLYPRGGYVADVPQLPWHHTSFWLRPQAKASMRGGAETRASMLGVHEQVDAQRHLWLKEDCDWQDLREHRLRNDAVLPGAALISLAWDAASAAGLDGWVPSDVRFLAVLPLDEACSLRTELQRRGPSEHHLTVTRLAPGGHGVSQLLMECEVRPAETQQTAAALSLLVEAQTRCLETIEPSVLYKQLADAGLDYGPSFRLLTEIWRRDGEALARVSAKVAAGFHSMSPHVLDSALHAIAAALPEELRSLYVPSGCGACIYSRAPKGSVRVHVALHDFSSQGETIQVDALLADETGSVVALLKDLRLRRLSPATQLVKAAARWSERTYATAWFAQDKSIAAALVRPKSRWLVLMDEARKAEDIAARLETEGQEVVRVAPFAAQPQTHPGARHERAMPSEIRSVIQREMGAGRPAFAGIVDCTRIGSASTDCATAEQVIDRSLLPFSDLARALAYDRVSEPPRLYVVTRDSQPVLESDSLTGLSNAPLWGFAKAMPFEQQELRCTRIDIDGTPSSVAPLVQLLLRHPEEDQYAVRHGTVYWPRLVHADPTTTRHRTAIHEDALYLVTGGLGGLGPHVCSWLVRSGARHVLLLGRHAPTKETLARLDSLRTSGAHIETVEIDVADFKAMEKLVTGLPKDRPLRGVIHAAGVLRDGAFLDVTRAQLVDVLKPKVTGAWNLHELTRTLPSLDFFVLFSSAASVVGSPGQASYMAANAYLDALAHHRRRHGMPALAVNWGPFAGSGMSAGSGLAEGLRTTGVQLIEPDQGMDLLGSILQLPMPQITVLPFDPESVVYHYPNSLGMRFFERLLGSAFSQVTRASVAHKLSERPALQTGYVAPTNEIEGVIAAFWQRALGVDRVGIEDAFFELGGDSVFAHQLLGQIQRAYSVQLDPAEAFEEFTVKNLALMVERALLAYVTQLDDEQAAELVDTRIGSEHAFSAKDA